MNLTRRINHITLSGQTLSPIPEVINSACLSPEFEELPISNSEKALGVKFGQEKRPKKKKKEIKIKKKFDDLIRFEKLKEKPANKAELIEKQKAIRSFKSPKEKIKYFLDSENRLLADSKNRDKTFHVPRFNLVSLKPIQRSFAGSVSSRSTEKPRKASAVSKKSPKVQSANFDTIKQLENSFKEIQSIVKIFAKKSKKKSIY